jgi:hypothetical protein
MRDSFSSAIQALVGHTAQTLQAVRSAPRAATSLEQALPPAMNGLAANVARLPRPVR